VAGDAAKGAGGLAGYLITKIGPFMSAYEELADGHFSRGMRVFMRKRSPPLGSHMLHIWALVAAREQRS
jgi:hypothetical protein